MEYQIRSPRTQKELEQVFDLLGNCFTRTSREYYVKRTLNDPNFELWQFQTLWKNGRPVSNVQIYDKNIWINGKKVKAAGIGSVATEVQYRNRGFASTLMCHAMEVIKNRGFKLALLFTKVPDFYEKFNFSVVPRVTCLFNYSPKISMKNKKIRRFCSRSDLSEIMQIHKIFSNNRNGCIIRGKKDWEAQRKYFNENDELFLVLENQDRITSYVRGRFQHESNLSNVKLVEYGSTDSTLFLLPFFLKFIFEDFNPHSVSITLSQEDSKMLALKCEDISRIPDNLMMYSIIIDKRSYDQRDVKIERMCFWEADGF